MTNALINYLLESSVCLIILLTVYKVLLSKLTYFNWMRFYLILSLVLSIILPIVILPVNWGTSYPLPKVFENVRLFLGNTPSFQKNPLTTDNQQIIGFDIRHLIYSVMVFIYVAGVIYKMGILVWNLNLIIRYIKQNPITIEENYRVVRISNSIPPFSFLNFIFISTNYKNLSTSDLQQIKDHEKVHIHQFHTIDLILIELSSIVFWFNPFIVYLKRSLQEVHEYIVDEKIARADGNKRSYTELLLNLTLYYKGNTGLNLTASFTEPQIKKRIQMMIKERSLPFNKFRFFILIPLTVIMLLSFSYINIPNGNLNDLNGNDKNIITQQSIGKISWSGNTVYSAKILNKTLGLKTGDKYVHEDVLNRLGNEVASLYLNNGYVFHKSDLTTQIRNDKVDLDIFVTEGEKAIIGEIRIKGNATVSSNDILKNITFKSGDFFSKEKLIASIKSLAAMGKFDPEKIQPSLIPNMEKNAQGFIVIDILFEVAEINK